MVTSIGTNGTNGTNTTSPTAGMAAIATFNGMINADTQTITAVGGNGGNGNTGSGAGANGANGGAATATASGDIFSPMGTSFGLTAGAVGGNGGSAGTPSASSGNGGNATATLSGNILQTSHTLSSIGLDAAAIGGTGTKGGNATATVSGNIINYSSAVATNVALVAQAFSANEVPGSTGSAFGTKVATVSGNIIQGDINNLTLEADAFYANGTATISGNIFTAKATNSGLVELEATSPSIAITGNILNLGTQTLDIALNEVGPFYSANVSGNIFNGTGANTLILSDSFAPGPASAPDTALVNLAAGTFTFDGKSNLINKFGSVYLTGDIQGDLIGTTTGTNILSAQGDSANVTFDGNGGSDFIIGGSGLNVAQYAGSDWQYAINVTGGAGTVVGGPAGNVSADALSGIQRLKFLSPASVSDVNDDGYGDLILNSNSTGSLQVNLVGAGAAITPVVESLSTTGFNAIGTGFFTVDTSTTNDRNSDLLLQNSTTGALEIASNLASGTPTVTAVTGSTPSLVTGSTFTGWNAVTAGDFNGDAASDILLQQGAGGPVEIAFLNTSSGQPIGTVDQISAVTSPSGGNWNAISSGDFNGDGKSDILWQNSTTGAVDISLMNGASGTPTFVGNAPAGFTAIGTGDFNGDGKSDILFYNSSLHEAEIWLMNGTSEVGSPLIVAAPTTPADTYTLVGAEDVNKDGISDLIWQGSAGNLTATEMTGTSNTVSVLNQNVSLGNMPGSPTSTFHLVASTGGG